MFKPSAFKIASALILFLLFSSLWQILVGIRIMDAAFYGMPWHFYTTWGPCQAGQTCSEFNWPPLLMDLAFWYMIGAFLVSRFLKK